jgi:ATP-dependent protease ClpP protease subunit
MPKDILLYGGLNEYSCANFINEVDDREGEDLVVRMNTGGGSPEYSFGAIAKFKEFEGTKKIKVDGKANSMGLFFLCYADYSEGLDVSEYVLHRAAYPDWVESNSDIFTEGMKSSLENLNKNLKTAFENKVDVAKFEELKGVKLKDVFSMDGRLDVAITPKEAKQIGLINKIVKITPQKKAEINALFSEKNNKFDLKEGKTDEKPTKIKKMTLQEFKSTHPEAFKAAFDEGVLAGVATELDRAASWMVFADADIKAVQKGIESGVVMKAKDMAELNRAAAGMAALASLEDGNIKPTETETAKTAETLAADNRTAFMDEVLTGKTA